MFSFSKFEADGQPTSSQPHRWKAVAGLGRIISLLAVLALFGPSAVLAQGSVTGINWEPTPVAACTLVKITVTGTGNCSSFSFDLGDGTPVAHFPGAFPLLFYHTYTMPQTYILTAQGQGTCLGKVNAALSVAGPAVTSEWPFSVNKPLGGVILQGEHFGSLPGQILLDLEDYTGHPIHLQLTGIQWADTWVAGSIPYIDRILKQTATFTVVTHCGATATWQAGFLPTTEVASIAWQRLVCSTSIGIGVSDQCQNSGGEHWPVECGLGGSPFMPGPSSPINFQGYHGSGWGPGNSGHDEFWPSPSLKNQWEYADVSPLDYANWGGGSQASMAGVNVNDPTTPHVGVDWHVDACGIIHYWGNVDIEGPLHVPY